jgi:hypothetical protein
LAAMMSERGAAEPHVRQQSVSHRSASVIGRIMSVLGRRCHRPSGEDRARSVTRVQMPPGRSLGDSTRVDPTGSKPDARPPDASPEASPRSTLRRHRRPTTAGCPAAGIKIFRVAVTSGPAERPGHRPRPALRAKDRGGERPCGEHAEGLCVARCALARAPRRTPIWQSASRGERPRPRSRSALDRRPRRGPHPRLSSRARSAAPATRLRNPDPADIRGSLPWLGSCND